jgi:hypothetical protein
LIFSIDDAAPGEPRFLFPRHSSSVISSACIRFERVEARRHRGLARQRRVVAAQRAGLSIASIRLGAALPPPRSNSTDIVTDQPCSLRRRPRAARDVVENTWLCSYRRKEPDRLRADARRLHVDSRNVTPICGRSKCRYAPGRTSVRNARVVQILVPLTM